MTDWQFLFRHVHIAPCLYDGVLECVSLLDMKVDVAESFFWASHGSARKKNLGWFLACGVRRLGIWVPISILFVFLATGPFKIGS